jgi:hypothetical protein
MATYITNAFSLNMLSEEVGMVRIVRNPDVKKYFESAVVPAIGHENTAQLVEKEFGLNQNLFNRCTVAMQPGDRAVIFQYSGPRLPEGATELPVGAKIVPVVVEAISGEALRRHVNMALNGLSEAAIQYPCSYGEAETETKEFLGSLIK